ncbi:MAG TPA: DUF2235 domain-containing protein [Amaricoccus sp.]|nr:DUF2235 domain-containing protein [Amaricoccus sp.]
MKRIVIACDGTWKRIDAERPTNVARLAQAVLPAAPDGVAQVVCHLDGVGTGRGTGGLARMLDRTLGGLFGQGLTATLAAAYRFLVFTYAPGDEVYLFGFSRGAFTARSLAGLIRNCGILERDEASAIPAALAFYRDRGAASRPDSPAALAFRARHAGHVVLGPREAAWRAEAGGPAGLALRLVYLGIWDTVGALGLPGHMRLAARLNRGLAFHDTALSGCVAAARHAVSIDERRRGFPPTLWHNLAALNGGRVRGAYQQRWFPGDHGSVGGGGVVTGLSSDALVWVAEGAAAAGLALDPAALAGWAAERDAAAPLMARGAAAPGIIDRMLEIAPRPRRGPGALLDLAPAALARWARDPGYRPQALARLAAALEAAAERGAA